MDECNRLRRSPLLVLTLYMDVFRVYDWGSKGSKRKKLVKESQERAESRDFREKGKRDGVDAVNFSSFRAGWR